MSPRKARETKPHRFNLDVNDDAHKLLHDHLVQLSYGGRASQWIIDTLIDKLISEQSKKPGVLNSNTASTQHVPNVSPKPKIAERPFTPVPKTGYKGDPLKATITKGKRSDDIDF